MCCWYAPVNPVEAHGHVQLLCRGPQRLVVRMIPGPPVHRIRRQHQRHRAQILHRPARLRRRQFHVLQGHLRRPLEPGSVHGAEVVQPIVEGATDGGREVSVHAVQRNHVRAESPKQHCHVDPLHLKRLKLRRRVETLRPRLREPVRDVLVPAGQAPRPRLRLRMRGKHLPLHVPPVRETLTQRVSPKHRRPPPIGGFHILLPQIVRLHNVHVAVHNPKSVLCHQVNPTFLVLLFPIPLKEATKLLQPSPTFYALPPPQRNPTGSPNPPCHQLHTLLPSLHEGNRTLAQQNK